MWLRHEYAGGPKLEVRSSEPEYIPPYVDRILGLYCVYIGIMEKKMESTIMGLWFIVPLK